MTGHIRQRSPGSWELRYRIDGKTRTATVRAKTKKEAEKELRTRLVAIDRGEPADPTKLTTGQWLDRWLNMVKCEIATATHEHYRRFVEGYLKPRLGHIPLARLSRSDVQGLFTGLANGGRADGVDGPLAASTRRQLFRVLNISLNRAMDLDMIGRNVAQVMRRRLPKVDVAIDMVVPTQEQAVTLLDAARDTALFAPILLALCTGCRRGEAAGLTWRNVDLDRGTITFAVAAKQSRAEVTIGRTKSGKSRVVSLGNNASEDLRRWRATQAEQLLRLGVRQTLDTPVCTRADGSRVKPNSITVDFWRLAKRLKLKIHYHTLRHGHATALLIAGVHPKVAQERLGHHSVAFTLDRYAHTIEQLHDDAASKVDSIFARSSNAGSN